MAEVQHVVMYSLEFFLMLAFWMHNLHHFVIIFIASCARLSKQAHRDLGYGISIPDCMPTTTIFDITYSPVTKP